MTSTDPNASEQKRGRHARRDDEDRPAEPADVEREPTPAADDEPEPAPADTGADAELHEPEPRVAPSAREEAPAEPKDVPAGGEPGEGGDDGKGDKDAGPASAPAERPPAPGPADARAADARPADARAADARAADDDAVAVAPPPVERRRPVERREEIRAEPVKTRSWHAIAHHPAGASLLTAAGLVTGLALAPVLFDRLKFEVATRAAAAARSGAAPWPGGGEPWFWPGWVATTATVVALVVLVVAALGIRLPDVVVLATSVVLAAATGRAAWATLDVLSAHLWELVPLCLVCLLAFGSAVTAVFRWRSGESKAAGAGAGEVAGVTLGAWLLVVLLFLGGSGIASSAQTHAFGNVTSPPQDLAGLLSVRAADAPALHDLRGAWVAQVDAAQITDDVGATAYAVAHHAFTGRFHTLLARGDDTGIPGLDDTWWLSLADARFGSQAAAVSWCSANGVATCTPRLISG